MNLPKFEQLSHESALARVDGDDGQVGVECDVRQRCAEPGGVDGSTPVGCDSRSEGLLLVRKGGVYHLVITRTETRGTLIITQNLFYVRLLNHIVEN